MMKFDLLSRNAIILLEEVISDQTIAKLISNNSNRPLDINDIANTGGLINNYVFPTPYNNVVPQIQKTELRIFFPNGVLQNKEVLNTNIHFQVLMHRDLWLIMTKNKDGKYDKKIRPYDIMHRIVEIYEDRSIGTLGKVKFVGYTYKHIDKDYGLYTLVGEMMTL